jgi:hypothetical protein
MKFNKLFKVMLVALLSITISHAPEALATEVVAGEMISTMEVVDSMSRGELENRVRQGLEREQVQNELRKLGVDPSEATRRVASLSQVELEKLALQMDQERYGGDVVGILVTVLLVLVIIYFAKRI